MLSHSIFNSPENNPNFAKICNLARAQDSEGMLQVLQLQTSSINLLLGKHTEKFFRLKTRSVIDIHFGLFNPLRWLIFNDEINAANWLWKNFGNYLHEPFLDAIFGKALAGHPQALDYLEKFLNLDLGPIEPYKDNWDLFTTPVGNVYLHFDQSNALRRYINGCIAGGFEPNLRPKVAANALLREGAIYGNAVKGNFPEMHQLIRPGSMKDTENGIVGCARLGFIDEALKMLAQFSTDPEAHLALSNSFWFGLGMGGNIEAASLLLSEYDPSRNKHQSVSLLRGYVNGGHVKQAIQLIAEGTPPQRQGIFSSFRLTNINHENYVEETGLKLKKIMQEYSLNYRQAQALLIKGVRAWLMQGYQLTKEKETSLPNLPPDLFIHISSYVTELSTADTLVVLFAVNKKLRDEIVNDYSRQAFGFFRNKKNIEAYTLSAEERHQKRIEFKGLF